MRSQVRQRLYPTLPSSPLDSWCAAGLMTLAWSGGVACALWFFDHANVSFGLSLFVPFAMLGGPQLTRMRLPGDFIQHHHRSLSQFWVLLIAVIYGVLGPDPNAFTFSIVLLLGVHGFALRYSRPDHLASLALLIPLIELQLAHVVLWPKGLTARIVIAVWMLLTLLIAAGVTTWLHARWARRHLRSDRNRYDNEAETGEGLWGRARFILILGLVLLPIGLGMQQGGLAASKALQPLPSSSGELNIAGGGGRRGTASETDSETEGTDDEVVEQPIRRAETSDLIMPSTILWHGKIAGKGREKPILHVKTKRDAQGKERYHSIDRPLYLIATTYDSIGVDGLYRSPSSEVVHYANDTAGEKDWIVFDQDLVMNRVVKYKILQRVLFHDSKGVKGTLSYLLHNRRLVALKAQSCRLDDDGTALVDPGDENLLSYQWWAQTIDQDLPIRLRNASQSRFLRLPSGPAFQDWILDARALCADLSDSEEIVRRVVEHFENNYQYDLEPSSTNGIDAFTDFFDNKRGYCSYFASAGMLYLRANGIPARVASGFLITEFSEAENAYVGRLSDAHAWLEVQQIDGSWRTVDPTPVSQRADLLAALQNESGSDLEPRPVEDNPLALDEEGREAFLKAAAEDPRFGLDDFMFTITTIVGLVASILVMGNVFARRAMRKHSKEHGLSPEAEHALDYWLRVRDLLTDLGFKTKRSQTTAEFCSSVQRWGGDFYRPLNSVTVLVYRARFGGYGWSDREQEYLDKYEAMLEQKLRESG